MKKYLLVIGLSIIPITSMGNDISPSGDIISKSSPSELSDCKFYTIRHIGYSYYHVVRCPNSTTSTTEIIGKTQHSTIIVDGIEFVRKGN